MSADALFVAFFGDGPKWENFVLTLAAPRGVSNFRPFRYGDHRVAPDVLSDLSTQEGRTKLIASKAILAARFGASSQAAADAPRQLLPLRKIEVTHLDYSPGNHSVYFRLGPLFDFRNVEDIRDALVLLPDDETPLLDPRLILFRSAAPTTLGFVSAEEERGTWVRLCTLLAAAQSPVKEEAKRAVYVRFQPPKRKGQFVPPDKLYDSEIEGPRFGWGIPESYSYELAWDHRIPALVGTNHSLERLDVRIRPSTANVELANHETRITSNYEQHALGITARTPSGLFETLTLTPSPDQVADSTGREVLAVEVKSLLGVRKSIWYRLKRSVATIGALAAIVTAAFLSDEIAQKGWEGFWSGQTLATFLLTAIPVIILKVIEETFRQ